MGCHTCILTHTWVTILSWAGAVIWPGKVVVCMGAFISCTCFIQDASPAAEHSALDSPSPACPLTLRIS